MTIDEMIDQFLSDGPPFAVVGPSRNREKYGNKVLRCYLQHGHSVYPIHPKESEIEDVKCCPNLGATPSVVNSVSIITPPTVTEKIVHEAITLGVRNLWMQPGAESAEAIRICEESGVNVIHGGPCLLVVMGYKE